MSPLAAGAPEDSELARRRALQTLAEAMTNPSSEVRITAAEQWGMIGDEAARRILVKALEDKNPYVRIASAGSLYQLGDDRGAKVLAGIAKDAPRRPDPASASAALEQMRALARNKARAAALKRLGLMERTKPKALLERSLKDADGAVRDAAAVGLARLGEGGRLDGFLEALRSEEAGVRLSAVRALGEVASERTADWLRPLAADPEPEVRAAVMEAFGAAGGAAALPELERALADESELVRAKAVGALGRLPDPRAAPLLRRARAQARNAFVELLALGGLARLGETVPMHTARFTLEGSRDADARVLAVEFLEAVALSPAPRPPGPGPERLLARALEDKDGRVRVRAAAALLRAGGARPAAMGPPPAKAPPVLPSPEGAAAGVARSTAPVEPGARPRGGD